MVMPLPSHLRLPSPTNKPASTSHPRSPVKKCLKESVSTAKVGSPQRLKSTVAQNVSKADDLGERVAPVQVTTAAAGGRLRAATLQTLLGLLDREDEALEKLLPLLHALAIMPLEANGVVERCLQALKQIQTRVAPSRSRHPSSARAISYSQPVSRESGRAKSSVSLKHCKDFLLACANEIHELEEVNPFFDYAEETGSEMAAILARQATRVGKQAALQAEKSPTIRPPTFDYASTVDSIPTTCSRKDALDDDTRADTGSQFSELLLRTVEAEREDHVSSMSLVDRVTCRRALHAWSKAAHPPHLPQREIASLFRAFAALKRHRAASQLSFGRKQRAFGRMKALLVPRSRQEVTPTRAPRALRLRTRVAAMVLLHWDLVLLFAIACAVQFGLQ